MSPHELQTSILNESLDNMSRSTSNMLHQLHTVQTHYIMNKTTKNYKVTMTRHNQNSTLKLTADRANCTKTAKSACHSSCTKHNYLWKKQL